MLSGDAHVASRGARATTRRRTHQNREPPGLAWHEAAHVRAELALIWRVMAVLPEPHAVLQPRIPVCIPRHS